MLFIGYGNGMHTESSKIKPNQFIYKRDHYESTRCVDSYLVSKKGAEKIINFISKLKEGFIDDALPAGGLICEPVDNWIDRVAHYLKLEIYWMEPTIVTQGSMSGKYPLSHVY